MQEKIFDAIYLATEDKNIITQFQQVFNDKLILPDCEYIDFDYNSSLYVTTYFSDRKNDKYLRGLEYIVSRWCRHKILSHINTQQIWTDAL